MMLLLSLFHFLTSVIVKGDLHLLYLNLQGDDLILCQIMSKGIRDRYSISLYNQDFNDGALSQDSNIRPNKLFTADERIISYKIGSLNKDKIDKVIEAIVNILKN